MGRIGPVCAAALLAAMCVSGTAQEKQIAGFSERASHALTLLTTLGRGLPDGPWRYHAGDVAHGEDPPLDDSIWPVGQGTYDTAAGSVWFRRTIVIPQSFQGYDLHGVQLLFQFHAFAHGAMPEILYVNGRRIAMGDNMEPVELVDRISPGETVHIAVKLLQTADLKHVTPASLLIRFDPHRPDPVALGEEIRSAEVLLPMLTADHAALDADRQTLNRAAETIDLAALGAGDSARFDTSLKAAQTILEPLKPVLQQASVDLVGNSHIDTAWVWPWTETVDVVRRTFSTALQLMPEYPNYIFTQSVALYAAWMQEKYPDEFAEMKRRTDEGRWEPVGGMWVEPDLNMPDGESLVRQLLIGKTFFRDQMGVDIKVGWNPDSFGYNWQLPQIYKRSGVDYFVTQKLTWNESNPLPLKLFWWQSPDGSRLLTYFPGAYDKGTESVGSATDLAASAKLLPGDTALMQLYGVGDHGGGPTRVMLDTAERWMQPQAVYPRLKFSTAASFFADAQRSLADAAKAPVWNYLTLANGDAHLPPYTSGPLTIPVWNDELYLEFHRGTYTSQAHHKQNMRVSERSMLDAEKLAAIASLGGVAYPSASLMEAWKKVLMNQFHDLAAGSSIASVYVDAERDYESVRQTTDEVERRSLDEIAARADTRSRPDAVPVLVFNPLAWPRTDVVQVEIQLPGASPHGVRILTSDGKPAASQLLEQSGNGRYSVLIRADDVPSLGYRVFQATAAASPSAPSDLKASATTLENAMLRVDVDPITGCITHLVDKRTSFDAIAAGGCGNELQTFVDLPKRYDAWNIDAEALDHMTPIRAADSVKLVEQGPLRAIIRVQRHLHQSTFTQDITLYAGMDRVDVKNDFDWQETHTLLKAAFPLAASSAQATYEIPFGSIQRPTTRNNSVERAKFEVPALRWADLGDGQHGFSLLNDSKYGYDATGNVLRLSLLRSPTYPDPNTDHGRQRFTYSLFPHSGTWQRAWTIRKGYQLNDPLIATQTYAHEGELGAEHGFFGIDGDNVVVTAVKKDEKSGDIILRLYEWQGKPANISIALPGKPLDASEASMMEDRTLNSLPISGGHVSVEVKPFEIHTIRIHYGDTSGLWTR